MIAKPEFFHELQQRSPEWFDARRGILTASGQKPWLFSRSATSNKARTKVLRQLASERHDEDEWDVMDRESTQRRMGYIPAVARGIALESDAMEFFGQENPGFASCGFVRRGLIGCSPDAINMERQQGLEIKCPSAPTMVEYCIENQVPEEYLLQIHISLVVTGFKAWNFMAFSTKYYPVCLRVFPDGFTEKVRAALTEFEHELQEQILIDRKYSYDRR